MPPPVGPSNCRAIFERVSALPVSARGAAIDEACTGDSALRRQIEQLLFAHDSLGGFLHTPAMRHGGEPDPPRAGPYEFVRKLGEGGMGRVYLSEPGPVAVKLIRRDLDPGTVTRRFQRERDMLSRLDHPNIARLLDGGTTEDGTPYLVLTYVDGVPLDTFCRERQLPLRQRLELFRSVCLAVSFAHRQLVIHRDLKPTNILVAGDATPVVLDFGLAKLARTALQHALDSTVTGHRLLTPEYASPEQVMGIPVTPAADVYALGVILYELLSGVGPHQFATWSMAEIVDVVCNRTAPPPSAAAADDVAPQLRGALDAIVMKAIAKAPASRYAHVEALHHELDRYLARCGDDSSVIGNEPQSKGQ